MFITATQSTWFLIGPIAKLLGYVMDWIFEGLNFIGIPNVGIAIILFTLVVKALMIPSSIKQQKYTKLQSIMAPELQLIQAKYKGKKDNASMMAQQEETKAVYEKYGASATGGCLQLLIQLPVMFALYQVIYHLPGYIGRLYDYYNQVATPLMGIEGWAQNTTLLEMAGKNGIQDAATVFVGQDGIKYVIDMLYNFDASEWQQFLGIFNNDTIKNAYEGIRGNIDQITNFLGFDLIRTPFEQMKEAWWVVLLPLLAGGLQFLSSKLMTQNQPAKPANGDENPMASSMKTMNYLFPIMTIVFCFTFGAGIGVYWVASSGVQLLIQIFVNKYMDRIDINEMVKENIEKANVKREKKGLKPLKVTNVLENAKSLEEQKERLEKEKEALKDQSKNSTEYYESHSTAKKGSLAAKAGMVQQYEERERNRKAGKID